MRRAGSRLRTGGWHGQPRPTGSGPGKRHDRNQHLTQTQHFHKPAGFTWGSLRRQALPCSPRGPQPPLRWAGLDTSRATTTTAASFFPGTTVPCSCGHLHLAGRRENRAQRESAPHSPPGGLTPGGPTAPSPTHDRGAPWSHPNSLGWSAGGGACGLYSGSFSAGRTG